MLDLDILQRPDKPTDLANTLLQKWADELAIPTHIDSDNPIEVCDWIESNMLIDRPRAPITGALLPKGPMRLAKYQARIVKEALRRDSDGKLVYSTILWSEPKKSGKTAIAAAVGMYMGEINDACHIYCLANDGKQSQDRIFTAMARCLELHNKLGGCWVGLKAKYSPPTIILPNRTKIEAIPCDAAGEAGSEPLLTIWSELWGYAQKHKARIWTELTIPPTLYGYAMRWVESYAGYEGESSTLWQLYDVGVNHGTRHPLFPNLPVYINPAANQLSFWSHTPRQPWQTKNYYAAEEQLLTPTEFRRIHKNEWVTSISSLFEDIMIWDRCANPELAKPLPVDDDTPVVIAIDAAYAGDTATIVTVSRHPDDPWDAEHRRVIERNVMVFKGTTKNKLDFTKTLEPAIIRLCENYNVYAVTYDPYQMHKFATDLQAQGIAPFKEFSQAGRRLRADKQLYDMVIHRHYIHSGNKVVRQHVMNCAKKEEGKHLRFVKITPTKPIDYVVATSMAVDECLRLNT